MAIKPRTTAQVLKQQAEDSKPATPLPGGDAKDMAAAHPVEAFAIAQAKAVDKAGDTALFEHLNEAATARETNNIKDVVILEDLRVNPGREVLATWPEPDSDKTSAGNKLPDKYSVPVYNAETRKTTPKNRTFYGTWFDATKQGGELAHEINLLSNAKVEGAENNKYSAWHSDDVKLELGKLRQRRTTMVNTVRRAVQIERQCAAIEDAFGDKVTYEFARKVDDDGNQTDELRSTKTPIIMTDATKRPEHLAVTTFLSYDVVAASKKGSTLAALRTSKRSKAGSTKGGAANSTKLPTMETFSTWTNLIATQLENDAFIAQLSKKLASDDGADIVSAVGSIYVALTPYFYDLQKAKLPPMNGVIGKKYMMQVDTAVQTPQDDAA